MSQAIRQLLLQRTQELLDAIADGDWPTYAELCAEDLTAFEPEARGQRVEGLGFHKFYFDMAAGADGAAASPAPQFNIARGLVRLGKKGEAQVVLKRLLKQSPGMQIAVDLLAKLEGENAAQDKSP